MGSRVYQALRDYKVSKKCYCCQSVDRLEFHHVNPITKTYDFMNAVIDRVNDILAEIKKCIVVCKKCHNQIHSGKIVLVNPRTCSITKKQFLEMVDKAAVIKKEKKLLCQHCGKKTKNNRCSECAELLLKYYQDISEVAKT